MTLEQLIALMERENVKIARKGEHICASSPKGLPESIRAALPEHKALLCRIAILLENGPKVDEKAPTNDGRVRALKRADNLRKKREAAEERRLQRRKEYALYLDTPHWAKVRKAALDRAEHRCQLCKSVNALQVHHNNYLNLWDEKPTDVIVLCRKCHSKHHGVPEQAPPIVEVA